MNTDFLIGAAAGFAVNTAVTLAGGKLTLAMFNDGSELYIHEKKQVGQAIGNAVMSLATALLAGSSPGFVAGTVASGALLGSLVGRRYISMRGAIFDMYVDLNFVPQNSPEAIKSGVIALASTVATTTICLAGLPYTAPLAYIIGHAITSKGCARSLDKPALN